MAYDNVLAAVPVLKQGISRVESGGNYYAVGPDVKRKSGVDRAYGKYQVMGSNIPSWTEEALGRKLTPFEFLHSPEAQEAVFENQMVNNLQKYGNLQDAASVWFSGKPLAQAQRAGARDVNMPVSEYVNAVMGVRGPGGFGEQYAQAQGPTTDVVQQHARDWMQQQMQEPPADPVAEHAREWARQQIEQELRETEAAGDGGVTFLPKGTPMPPGFPGAEGAPAEAPAKMPAAPAAEAPQTPRKPAGPLSRLITGEQAPAPWGLPQEYANVVAAGYLPEALGQVSQYTPEQYEKARAAYETEYPYRSAVAGLAGGVTQAIPLAMAGGAGLAAIAPRVAQVAPRLATAIDYGRRFFTGMGGRTAPFPSGGTLSKPGAVAAAERVVSPIVAGGLAGAGSAFINQKLRPDIPVSEQVLEGGLTGAVLAPAASVLFGTQGPSFSPRIEPPTRELATRARAQGIPITPWQVSPFEAEQQVAARMLSEEQWQQQAKKFGEAAGKTFGLKGEFTPKNVDDAVDAIGDAMETLLSPLRIQPVAAGNMVPYQGLQALEREVRADITDPALQAKLFKSIQHLATSMMQQQTTGKILQGLTKKDGYIDKNFPAKTDSVNKYFNRRLKALVYDYLEYADPAANAEWEQLRNMYKNGILGMKMATPSGVPNAAKLPAAAKAVGAKGTMKELAEIATLVPKLKDKGTGAVERVAPKEGKLSGLKHVLPVGAGLAEMTPALLSAATTTGYEFPIHSLLGGLAATGAGYAIPAMYRSGRRAALSRKFVQDAILSGQAPALFTAYGINPLAAAASTTGLTMEERVRRRK